MTPDRPNNLYSARSMDHVNASHAHLRDMKLLELACERDKRREAEEQAIAKWNAEQEEREHALQLLRQQ